MKPVVGIMHYDYMSRIKFMRIMKSFTIGGLPVFLPCNNLGDIPQMLDCGWNITYRGRYRPFLMNSHIESNNVNPIGMGEYVDKTSYERYTHWGICRVYR